MTHTPVRLVAFGCGELVVLWFELKLMRKQVVVVVGLERGG